MMRWNPADVPGHGMSMLPAEDGPGYKAIPLMVPEGKWALVSRCDYPEIRHDRKSANGKRVLKKNVLMQRAHCRWRVDVWAGVFDSENAALAFAQARWGETPLERARHREQA